MFKKSFFSVFFLSIIGLLMAQTNNPSAVSILEKTAQKFTSLSAFSLDFTMKIEENGKTLLSFKGTAFGKKEKYFISFDEQIIANDGKMMWNYQKNSNEVMIFDAKDDDFVVFHPNQLLSNWDKEYSVKFIREEELQKKQVSVLDLTPKKKSQFYKIRLFIDKGNSYIQQIMMYEIDGPTTTYFISKFTPNAAVTDAKFTFNKNNYPNVQVIDMR